MILDINGKRVKFLGDVHLGRTFRNGVPLHRRGERETMVRNQFFEELNSDDFDTLVQVGDLFDKFRVDLNDVVYAADRIRYAGSTSPEAQFYFMAGNHDLARDTEKISSFELVARLCHDLPNVEFLTEPMAPKLSQGILMIPWSPIKSAAELVEPFTDKVECVVGHWDHTEIAGDFNLIPLDKLKTLTKLVISGHDHVAREYKDGKTRVVITGSMQPLSHAEDPEGKLYVTRTLAEVETAAPAQFIDHCLRILAPDGAAVPDVDCLQLTVKRLKDDEELEVGFDDGLNMQALFTECFAEVDPEVTKEVKTHFDEALHA